MNNPSIKRNLNIEYRWNDKQYLSHENFVKLLNQKRCYSKTENNIHDQKCKPIFNHF